MSPRPHAIVTGSSGGIGSAVCTLLLASGFDVTGVDRALLREANWRQIATDLAVPGQSHQAGVEARAHAPVSHLVHCAAVQVLGAAGEVDAHGWSTSLQVNVLAVDELVRATREDLRAAGGAIVVVSSVHATATTRGMVAYATSKAAVHGWVRAAALDLAPEVRVNAVQPGAVDTDMLRSGLERRAHEGAPDEALTLLAAKTPLGIIAQPSDVAELVLVLLTPTFNRFVTGSVLTADGGALLRLGTE